MLAYGPHVFTNHVSKSLQDSAGRQVADLLCLKSTVPTLQPVCLAKKNIPESGKLREAAFPLASQSVYPGRLPDCRPYCTRYNSEETPLPFRSRIRPSRITCPMETHIYSQPAEHQLII